jgi:hypothetical protein
MTPSVLYPIRCHRHGCMEPPTVTHAVPGRHPLILGTYCAEHGREAVELFGRGMQLVGHFRTA